MTLARIIADSINQYTQDRITTFVLPNFPKLLQAELRTHRSLSQSHYSSRAIPIKKALEQVITNPFVFKWTREQKGMGGSHTLTSEEELAMTTESLRLRDQAVETAKRLLELGAAKQEANRYLEPWMVGPCVLTGTDMAWQHFFELRTVPGTSVQPDFRAHACEMERLYIENNPISLDIDEWHIPFTEEHVNPMWDLLTKLKVATARCARISYKNYDGTFEVEKDVQLYYQLVSNRHFTPLEHSAIAVLPGKYRNLSGWMHLRQHIEDGFDPISGKKL